MNASCTGCSSPPAASDSTVRTVPPVDLDGGDEARADDRRRRARPSRSRTRPARRRSSCRSARARRGARRAGSSRGETVERRASTPFTRSAIIIMRGPPVGERPDERAPREAVDDVAAVGGRAAHVVDRRRAGGREAAELLELVAAGRPRRDRPRRRRRGVDARPRGAQHGRPDRAERDADAARSLVELQAEPATAITIALRGPTFAKSPGRRRRSNSTADDQLVGAQARLLRADEELVPGDRARARRRRGEHDWLS